MEPDTPPAGVPTGLEQPDVPDDGVVSWTASEFIARDKGGSWYLVLVVGAVGLAALLYFLTKDWVTSGVVIVAALFFGIYGAHKPRQLPYQLDRTGLTIGNKRYSYAEFRSFHVVPEGAFSSITLMPLRRFAVPTSIYYDPNDEERILTILADHLPFEERKPDAIDSLMRRVRF